MFHGIWCIGIAILVLVTVIEDQKRRWLLVLLSKMGFLAGPETRYSFDQRYRGIESLIMKQFDLPTLNTCWDSPLLIPPREIHYVIILSRGLLTITT